MLDLDKLIAPGSSLKLSHALAITDRGEIVGIGVPPGCPRSQDDVCGHAYVLVPCAEAEPHSCDEQVAASPKTEGQFPDTQHRSDSITFAPGTVDEIADMRSAADNANSSRKPALPSDIRRAAGRCSPQGAECIGPRFARCCPGLVCEITGLRGFCTSKPF